MTDCDVLRARRPGLPKCCTSCHHRAELTAAHIEGKGMRLCCHVYSALMRIHRDGSRPEDDEHLIEFGPAMGSMFDLADRLRS